MGYIISRPIPGYSFDREKNEAEAARVRAAVENGAVQLTCKVDIVSAAAGTFKAVHLVRLTGETRLNYEGDAVEQKTYDKPEIALVKSSNLVGDLSELITKAEAAAVQGAERKAQKEAQQLENEAQLAQINELLEAKGLDAKQAVNTYRVKVALSLDEIRQLLA